MVQVHMVLGVITLVVGLVLLIWNAVRIQRQSNQKSFRMILVGLLDLQVLLGLITFFMHPIWGKFLLHPICMLIAVAIGHVLLKESRSPRTQLTGYSLVMVLLLAGAWMGSFS